MWPSDPRYQECVPVPSFETSWSTTGNESSQDSRCQLPPAPCWSIAMHKSQGKNTDKIVTDPGKSEATAGLIFVCLSRARRLGDLLIEPMPFERLSKLGERRTFQLRLREEVRLRTLAEDTLDLHGVGLDCLQHTLSKKFN